MKTPVTTGIPTNSHADRTRGGLALVAWGTAVGLALTLWAGSLPEAAELPSGPLVFEQEIDGHTVRWSTTVTGFLPRRTIETHGLKPTGRGVLNVVVLESQRGKAPPSTVRAEVSATVTDLYGRVRPIDMRIVTENDRISYLGTFDVEDRDPVRFDLRIQPPGKPARTIEFQRRFYVE